MKVEPSAHITQEVQRELPEENMEKAVNTGEVGGESLDNLGRDESRQYISESYLAHASSRSPILRADSVPSEGISEVVVDGFTLPPVVLATTSENDSSQQSMEVIGRQGLRMGRDA